MEEKDTEFMRQHEIMQDVIREQLDYMMYFRLDTGEVQVIVSNDTAGVLPSLKKCVLDSGSSASVIVAEDYIMQYVHPGDQAYYRQQLSIDNILRELEQKKQLVSGFRLLVGERYRRKEVQISCGRDADTIVLSRRDVTERYEEERKQKEKIYRALMDARHANQEKGDFLTRMSHEIRTPMNSIIGLVYLTKENADNRRQVQENLDKIEMSAHFLLSFVDDILNLSQIESGNVALNQEDTDIRQFLEKLGNTTEALAREKGIAFSMRTRGDFEEEYCFDAEKLEKALSNILSNAVKFTSPGGKVDFIVELVATEEERAVFRFEVRDNGIGMDEKFLKHVFEPFEQEDNGSTTISGGTGLGLAISKNIIDFMDGRIDVYSEKGFGSSFVVTVSLERVEDCEASLRKQNKSKNLDYDFSGKRVLLVEDNDINIEITRNLLLHKNFAVEVATNGREGVDMFLEHEPGYYDVILMDIRMPVMDGLTAAQKIRESRHGDSDRIPIVAMTANVFEEDVRKSFEAGMDAHLNKPVDVKQMYSLLDGILFE